jgi:endogenous inhibitor of DNA gyrase (YacG/DUF329 family)
MADLGRWLSGDYRVSGQPVPEPHAEDETENEND